MFALMTIHHWRRSFSAKVLNEPRPHIVPLSPEAEAFVLAQLRGPCKDALFGPLYTGYGFAEVEGRMVPAFCFTGDNNLTAALQLVQERFEQQRRS